MARRERSATALIMGQQRLKAMLGLLWMMLRYWRLIALGVAASTGDALCKVAGFAGLLFLVDQFFLKDATLRGTVEVGITKLGLDQSNPQLAQSILAQVPAGRYEGFLLLIGVLLALTILGSVLRYFHQYLVGLAVLRFLMRMRLFQFCHVMRMSILGIENAGPFDLLMRLSGDLEALGRGLRVLLGKTVRELLGGGALLLLALYMNWKLTATFLIMAPVLVWFVRFFGRAIIHAVKGTAQSTIKVLAVAQEALGQLPVVKLYQAEGFERRRFVGMQREFLAKRLRMVQVAASGPAIIELLGVIAGMFVAIAAGWLVLRQDYPPTDLIKVLAALFGAGASLQSLTGLANELSVAAVGAIRIDQALKHTMESRLGGALPRHSRSIVFENVVYTYPERDQPAIRGISLEVRHGMRVAIVGPNGSGKTTLMLLLTRLLDPDSGRILVDGVDIAQVGVRSLRRQIAMVTQATGLFPGTMAENIAYGRRRPDLPRVVQAAKAAYADEFIAALPYGYDSTLGEFGSGLSGGQRQRLCIARAVYRDPTILILDEATSQIDADSEHKINVALRQFQQGRTTFAIAHRLSTVVDADLIVVMDQGRIVDQGRHDELLQRCPVYQLLCKTQLIGAGKGGE